MEQISLVYKLGTAFLGGLISYLFGSMTPLLHMLVLFVILDYISGVLASAYEGNLSSSFGFKGILKKIFIFLIIAIAHNAEFLIISTNHPYVKYLSTFTYSSIKFVLLLTD
ncbi:phage holin family protein [Peribacillus sp. JNUCC 23]